jgi:carboxyl-terminal processing protease
MASRIYSLLQGYYNGWHDAERADFDDSYRRFDESYRAYLTTITRTDDRRAFDLATMQLVASLHNAHTSFDDRWLETHYGGSLGFYAEPVQGQWVVTRSDVPTLRVGDAIVAIDGQTIEAFFQAARSYLMDSDEHELEEDLFASSYLFPKEFSVTLSDHRTVRVARPPSTGSSQSPEAVEGRWLEPDRIAYIRIPGFSGIASESEALAFVHQFKAARGLIIDLRGNPGGFGNPPLELQAALMDRPFRAWRESLGRFASSQGNRTELVSENSWAAPETGMNLGVYTGPLVILVDHICASYCEDFVMPFKDNHRATVVGDTTAGTYAQTYFTAFDNGMQLNIAVTHEVFPDGSPFEGVGIAPDIALTPTIEDIRSRTDVVLARGVEALRSLRAR